MALSRRFLLGSSTAGILAPGIALARGFFSLGGESTKAFESQADRIATSDALNATFIGGGSFNQTDVAATSSTLIESYKANQALADSSATSEVLTGTFAGGGSFTLGDTLASGGAGYTVTNGSGVLITSFTVTSPSGTQPSGSVTPMFGFAFAQGVLPAGTAPQFQTAAGVSIPFSMTVNASINPAGYDAWSKWGDGSMKHCTFALALPVAVVAGTPLTVNVLTGGGYPAASGVAMSNLTAGSVLLGVEVDGQDNLSGTYRSSLTTGVTNYATGKGNYVFMDGGAGPVWRIIDPFRLSGTAQGYLTGFWYAHAVAVSGTFYGIRHICRITTPWWQNGLGTAAAPTSTTSQTYLSFVDIRVMTNTTKIRSLWVDPGYGASQNFTFTPVTKAVSSITQTGGLATVTTTAAHGFGIGSKPTLGISGASPSAYNGAFACTVTTTNQFTFAIASGTASPATGTIAYTAGSQTFAIPVSTRYQQGWMVKLSTTNTLPTTANTADPAGLGQIAPGVAYFYNPPGGSTTTFNIGYNSSAITNGGEQYTAFDDGVGTHTIQAYPYITPFSSIFTATTTGDWNYTQGAGSVATDAQLIIGRNASYDVSTTVFPPYEFTNTTIPSIAATNYLPNTTPPTPFVRFTETSGQTISLLPPWDLDHLYNGTTSALQNVKVASLAGSGLWSICMRDSGTGALVVGNNTTYAGMPAPTPTFSYSGGQHATGVMTNPTPSRVLLCGVDQQYFSHIQRLTQYSALVLGDPLRIDMTHEWGNVALLCLASNLGGFNIMTASNYALNNPNGNTRTLKINNTGTIYYGIVYGSPQTRGDAWAMMHLSYAAMFASAENQSYQQYFKDIVANQGAFASAIISTIASAYGSSSYPTTHGLWYNNEGPIQMFEASYVLTATAFGAAACNSTTASGGATGPNTNLLTAAGLMMKWFAHINVVQTSFLIGSYVTNQAVGINDAALITSDALLLAVPASIKCASGTTTFTVGAGATISPAVNDIIMFSAANGFGVPGGFSGYVLYYILSVSGSLPGPWSITLGSSPGGAAISTTAAMGFGFYFTLVVGPPAAPASSTGKQVTAANSVGYLLQIIGSMNLATAYGAAATLSSGDQSVVATQVADMQTRYIAATPNNINPIYHFAQTFE